MSAGLFLCALLFYIFHRWRWLRGSEDLSQLDPETPPSINIDRNQKMLKSRSWDKWVPIWKKWGGSEQKIHNTVLTSMLINQTRTFPLSRIPLNFTQHCLCAHSLLLDIFIVFEIMDISHAIGGCKSQRSVWDNLDTNKILAVCCLTVKRENRNSKYTLIS